ncbi:MAG: DUF190 domain-containing protein [Deltaproteobacteria bacterium]|jgi:uncharacterized protein|nr:DUF190 domain-containing protein [Deltaproteobacteria bacterium]MBT4266118.1 DUF190 domain-containing protein [Deltaproteobacteria bacterium]MBT4642882.1 DUF190 domain-containing protein [Deltaproteobacteria bacterium]MBT6504421.1 DUF190 domain-containing protein [Deltaproteobacteria bacterium]MBT6615469.1 DUF190 domain-containing protein [Deltaproteobacteria bacterium]
MSDKYIGKRLRVRITVGSAERYQGKSLFRALIKKLEENQIYGATVIRGIGGFSRRARFHTDRLLSLISNLPVIVEFVDYEERIHDLLPVFDGMISNGMITLEEVEVIFYRNNSDSPARLTGMTDGA